MAVTITNFDNIVNEALDFYIRGDAIHQALQEKPLLRDLTAKQKTFPGGKEYISQAVQIQYISDTAGFFAGYTQDDVVTYQHPDNTLRARYPWKEVHAGINLTMTELKQDGISVVDSLTGEKTSEHSDRELTAITNLLDGKLNDMGNGWAIEFNEMLWRDGTQDALAVPGVRAILTDTPTTGTTGNISRATYSAWRHRALVGDDKVTPSAENQSLIRKMRYEIRQLRRYGGKPNKVLAGSGFLDALEYEFQAKGQYTVAGFSYKGKNDVGMADISIRGVGTIEYDPTLDALGLSNHCVIYDDTKLLLYVMEGEDKKTHTPARPYDQYVILRSMTWTGGLCCWQLNGCGIYEVNWTVS